MKTVALVFFMVVLAAVSFVAGYFARPWIKTEHIHVLKEPLEIVSYDTDEYWLPAGTALYLDWQAPEGFYSYRIYVNVYGGVFPVEKVKKFNLIIPLHAWMQ